MKWIFPIKNWFGSIPTGKHPGAFGTKRKYDIHTGVDLYTNEHEPVFAVEDGFVVNIENFTGPEAGSPWWLPTQSILIEGASGVICYGEIDVNANITIGMHIKQGSMIGTVTPVLQKEKIRKDIREHSCYMLHFELYTKHTTESVWWKLDEDKPKNLLNPTNKLIEAKKITMEKK